MWNLTHNLSNSGQAPHHLPHRNYIVRVEEIRCHYMMGLPWNEMCSFVKENPKCNELVWHIKWLHFMFCRMKMDTPTFITMLGIIFSIVMIFLLSLVIISFIRLAPSFIAVAHLLRLDEHTAGAVLLVILSYAGDVVENAQLYEADTTTAFNEALGAAMMTLALLGGCLGIFYQFTISPVYFTRDSIFMIFGLTLTTILYIRAELLLYHAIMFMAVYILFLLTILLEFVYIQAKYRIRSNTRRREGDSFSIEDMDFQHKPIKLKFHVNDSLQYGELEGANTFLLKQFAETINPVRPDVFDNMNKFHKCCFIVGVPLHVFYILCIPCFDYTLPNHGWSKLMICVNLMLCGPILTLLFTLELQIFLYTWIPGFILAMIVFFTSRTDRPPKYHIVFAFLALSICGCFQFMLERELMSILHTVGIFLGLRRETNALSTLALADNIGLAVWVFRLANWGYPKIAFAAVFCAALLDTVYSLGLIFAVKFSKTRKKSLHVFSGEMGPTSALYVISLYVFTYFSVALCKFQIRRSLGIALVTIYVLFISRIYLSEFHIIHGLGTDHSKSELSKSDAVWA